MYGVVCDADYAAWNKPRPWYGEDWHHSFTKQSIVDWRQSLL